MNLKRSLLAVVVLASLAGAAFLARESETSGQKMASAANKLLGSLDAKQKDRAGFGFDDKERTRWFFTPQQNNKTRTATRKGLPLGDMNDKQKDLAMSLLKASTSEDGYKKASLVLTLESILAELEGNKKGGMVRDSGWYFVAIFGSPSNTGKWGWRFEGHHLSLNFTIDGGKVVSATPCFYGANPALVKAGKRKGLQALPEAEESFRTLVKSLDAEQKKVAAQSKGFREIEESVTKPGVGKPIGLAAEKMNKEQKAALQKLIDGYAGRMLPDVANTELAEIKKAGFDSIHFAYSGDGTAGNKTTYRVQGPTFVIEFLNEQNDSAGNVANHIHSSWRNIKGDFALARQ